MTREERIGDAVSIAAFALLTVWWVWPLPLHAVDQGLYDGPRITESSDGYLILWALSWGAHALATAPWSFFDANAFYPSPLSLAYSEHFLGHQPLFAPVYLLTGNPVLAGNIVVMGVQFLSAVGAFALARRFLSSPAAFLVGLFYAFCSYRYLTIFHYHVQGVQYLPLVILFVDRWLDGARRRDAILLSIALTLQMLSSVYLMYATAFLCAAFLPAALWAWRDSLDRRRLLGLGCAFAVPLAAVIATSLPYLELRQLGLIPSYGQDAAIPLGIRFAPRQMARYLSAQGVGWIGYFLAAVAVLPPWRPASRWRVYALIAVAVGVTVGTGPFLEVGAWRLWTPYRWLIAWVPGFAAIRVLSRLSQVSQLGFALLAGLGGGRLLGWVPRPAGWPIGAVAAVIILWSLGPWRPHRLIVLPVGDTVPAPYRWLAEHGDGRAVLELPEAGPLIEARRMFLSTYHWLPIVGGYSAYPPGTARWIRKLAAKLPNRAALQAVVDAVDIGWIVVNLRQLPTARRWKLPAGLEVAARWPGALILRVTRQGNPVRQARLLSSTETLEGTPIQPIGGKCPGRLEPIGRRRKGRGRGRGAKPLVLPIRIHNEGTETWPAFGFLPQHLVQLEACIHPAGSPNCGARRYRLPADVRPGRPIEMVVPLPAAPHYRVPRVVRMELVQVGDGSLERCGVAAIEVPLQSGPFPGRPAPAPRTKRP